MWGEKIMKKSNEKGVTLIALVVTVIVLLILAGVGTYEGIENIKVAKDKSQWSQLNMVQHAILERYAEYKLTGDSDLIIGQKVTNADIASILTTDERELLENNGDYYILDENDFKKLGITQSKNKYLVNYETGEVYDMTNKKDPNGERYLYISK